ncbi:MAG: tetratricopeptide repeat protein [Deltaproteobacteria bacterium]|nr:tetratricopeptide repeat protein [Deltaproteobacteria bacterium]
MNRTVINLSMGTILTVLMLWGLLGCATTPLSSIPREQQAQAHLDLAAAYLRTGDYTASLRELKDAVKLQPKDPEIHYSMGIAYHGAGFTDKAVDSLKRAIDLKSDYSDAHNYLGTIYLARNDYDNAMSEFSRALSNELYETPDLALYNMGLAYFRMGVYSKAIDSYSTALRRNPNSRILFFIHKDLGVAYLSDGNSEKAIEHLKKSIELAPYIAESHYWLGMSYLRVNDMKGALKELRTAVDLDPQSPYGKKAQECLSDVLTKGR